MLLGEYSHTLDSKGRVIIPVKFRDDLGNSFIVTKGLDESLFVYSKSEWEKFENKIRALPITSAATRTFARFMFSGATECELDKQGRINLPQSLIEYAKLKKEVYIIGVSTRVEIWDKKVWEDYNNQDNMNLEEIASQMSNLGI